MKKANLKLLTVLTLLTLGALQAKAHHPMQHGFILTDEDTRASHLVAVGPHSRQAEITGTLTIDDRKEKSNYEQRKANHQTDSYYVFQAQNIDLPALAEGQVLNGHIIESKKGDYNPDNIIVREAAYKVIKIHLNIENPFFKN